MKTEYRTSKYLAIWQVEGSYSQKRNDDHNEATTWRPNFNAYIVCRTFERACEIYRDLCKKRSKADDPLVFITKVIKLRSSKWDRFDLALDNEYQYNSTTLSIDAIDDEDQDE